MVEEMQPLRGRALRLLLHLSLLAALLAIFLVVSKREPPVGTYQTTVSAFRVHSRRVRPPIGNPAVRGAVERVFSGVPQHGTLLGDPDAPVTMLFLADPECPQARQFAVQLLPRLVRHWVRSGKLQIEYLGEPAETIWPEIFERQQLAVLAAGRQGKLWQYLELFYRYQGAEYTKYADNWFLAALAREASLGAGKWRADRRTFKLALHVQRNVEFAQARNIFATPAFLIRPTGGPLEPLLHFTLTEPLAFEAAFREALTA
jgi:protein-disulfide isomerase